MSTNASDARFNRIDPELRAAISAAAAKNDRSDLRLVPVKADGRPFMIQTEGNVPAYVFHVLADHGLMVIGVSHLSGYTNVHVKEA